MEQRSPLTTVRIYILLGDFATTDPPPTTTSTDHFSRAFRLIDTRQAQVQRLDVEPANGSGRRLSVTFTI